MTDKINIKLTGFALLVPFVDVAQDSAIVQALDLQWKSLKNRILKVISKFKYFCSCLNRLISRINHWPILAAERSLLWGRSGLMESQDFVFAFEICPRQLSSQFLLFWVSQQKEWNVNISIVGLVSKYSQEGSEYTWHTVTFKMSHISDILPPLKFSTNTAVHSRMKIS